MVGKIKKTSNIVLASAWVFLITPVFAFADTTVQPDDKLIGSKGALVKYVSELKDWILALTALIALIIIVYGGVMYMLAAGDEKRASKAKNIILYGLIGVVVIVGAYFLISLVTNFLQSS
jgi:hypothetical protein